MNTNHSLRMTLVLLAVPAGMLPMAGCGGGAGDARQTEPVHGGVTFQSVPVPDAELVWTYMGSGEALSVRTTTDAEGRFAVRLVEGDGLPQGRYKVVVRPLAPEAEIGADVPPPAPVRTDIPAEYRQMSTTPLEFQVGAGPNQFDVELGAVGR